MKSVLRVCALFAFSLPAFGQGLADLDAAESKDKKSKKSRSNQVREIEKGTYAKANVGGALYLGNFAGFVQPGTALGLSLGSDFIDQENSSMAIEASFTQGIHNGCEYESQVLGTCSVPGQGPLVQGDLRTYTLAGVLEWSFYPSRRVGLGLRAGGGMLFSPLLMDEQWYQDSVVAGAWGGQAPTYHTEPHPVVLGGPTLEYYTKLSHFSVGFDLDVFYATGFDLGLNPTGALKYTF